MIKYFLTLRDEQTGLTIVREVGFLPEYMTSPEACRAHALRWIDERGNDQHDTTLSLLNVVGVNTATHPATATAYAVIAGFGAH